MNATTKPFRGGRVFNADEAAEPEQPRRRRYPCFANGCPMPGTMWPGAGMGGTGDRPGTCVWHYGVAEHEIPRVTQVLNDWGCVAYEVDECRRVHTSTEVLGDPGALAALFQTAVERLRPQVQMGGWADEFEANGRTYRDWGRHLEAFIGGQVVQALSTRQRRAA